MHDGVVSAAEQGRVGQVGQAAVDPVNQMMRVAPRSGGITRWEGAMAVAQPQRADLALGEQSLFPPHIQDLPVPAHHDRDDPRVAGQLADRVTAQRVPSPTVPNTRAAPNCADNVSKSMVSMSTALGFAVGSPVRGSVAVTDRRNASINASPRRRPAVRSSRGPTDLPSASLATWGADSGPMAASITARPSLSVVNR
jgi:hypothetical protein